MEVKNDTFQKKNRQNESENIIYLKNIIKNILKNKLKIIMESQSTNKYIKNSRSALQALRENDNLNL